MEDKRLVSASTDRGPVEGKMEEVLESSELKIKASPHSAENTSSARSGTIGCILHGREGGVEDRLLRDRSRLI